MAIFATLRLGAKKGRTELIYCYTRRGVSRAADGDDGPLELYLYGHVSGASQGRGQVENYAVKTRHTPIRLHDDN